MTAVAESRRLRVVVAKPGLDGHDRGAKIIFTPGAPVQEIVDFIQGAVPAR